MAIGSDLSLYLTRVYKANLYQVGHMGIIWSDVICHIREYINIERIECCILFLSSGTDIPR